MQLQRNEILTGLLVIGTIGVIAFLLVLLGAPGLFRPLVTYGVYFDNAAGIKPGAVVMLAGRKIGQVQKLYSPLTPAEEKQAQQAAAAIHPSEPSASPSPSPRFEARVDVQVDKSAHALPRRQGPNGTTRFVRRHGNRFHSGHTGVGPRKKWRDIRRRTHIRISARPQRKCWRSSNRLPTKRPTR